MLNRCSRAWWTLLLTLTVAVPVTAQNTVGEISGYVRDTAGGALPGVDVRILFPDIGVERSTQTNAAGSFLLAGLPPAFPPAGPISPPSSPVSNASFAKI